MAGKDEEGSNDHFQVDLKKSLAATRTNVMQDITLAMGNCIQTHFVEQLANELLAAHESALEVLSSENEGLRRRLEAAEGLQNRLSMDTSNSFNYGGGSTLVPSPRGSHDSSGPALHHNNLLLSWASEEGGGTSDRLPSPARSPRPGQGMAASQVSRPGGDSEDRPQIPERVQEPAPECRLGGGGGEGEGEDEGEASDGGVVVPEPKANKVGLHKLASLASEALSGLLVDRGLSMDEEPTVVDPGSLSARLVRSQYFESFFSTVILLNCFSMGVEAHFMVQERLEVLAGLELMEHVFTTLFIVELTLRFWVYGWRAFMPTKSANMWNFMDLGLVSITGVLFGWIMPLLAHWLNIDSNNDFLRTLTVLRAVRLLRVVRVVRRVHAFREVYLLLKGLSNSMRILLWTCVVIFFVTYVFAVFGLWLISKEIKQAHSAALESSMREIELAHILTWVGGLDRILRTLIQFLTLDSWNSKLETMTKYISWSWIYFYAYIAVAVFVLMNLVTAIIVENAMSTSRQDADHQLQEKEKQMHRDMEELRTLFRLMDTDCGGTLDWSEFQQSFDNEHMRSRWRLLNFNPTECQELFNLLDDGDGEIATDEFFQGLQKMKGPAQSKDMVRLNKQLDRLSTNVFLIAQTLGLKHLKKTRFSSALVGPGCTDPHRSQRLPQQGLQRPTSFNPAASSPLPLQRLTGPLRPSARGTLKLQSRELQAAERITKRALARTGPDPDGDALSTWSI